MDTGAKTSALHVENVIEHDDGLVEFDVVRNRGTSNTTHVKTKIHRRGRVRSSNGQFATRVFVQTKLAFAGMESTVEFSLVDRTSMIHRVLLGRTSLTEVLVDVNRRYRQKPIGRTAPNKTVKQKAAKKKATKKKARKGKKPKPAS
ncbi:MAG: hypothetical protein ACJAQZ_003853 [Planctomycetota bacterium]|jgi:hypothetical protein